MYTVFDFNRFKLKITCMFNFALFLNKPYYLFYLKKENNFRKSNTSIKESDNIQNKKEWAFTP